MTKLFPKPGRRRTAKEKVLAAVAQEQEKKLAEIMRKRQLAIAQQLIDECKASK
jgi:hypothetical protein